MGGVSDRHRRGGPAAGRGPARRPAGGRSPVCRPARSSRCCSQFRLQISQELLSRLRRAAGYFPGMPCYEHFVTLQKSVFVPLVFFLISHLGTRTGLYYIVSTALPVCDNHRINRHKVFAGLAQRGKMGWFFGFKLHLVFNNCHEIVALKLTPGNVHDSTPVSALTRDLTGKLFGDKGSIGQKLAEDLLRRGLTLFTRIRKNMKSLPMSLHDKALLKARNMAETIIGQIKEFSSLNLANNLAKHRSVINAFVHIIAAITAYQINPFKPKPKRNLQPRYRLQTTA